MGKRLRTQDAQFNTHEALYANIAPGQQVQIVENVTEYPTSLIQQKLGDDFELKSVKIDPRIFGVPCCRARLYAIAWGKDMLQWTDHFSLEDFLDCLTSQVALDALEYWWMDLPTSQLTPGEEVWLQLSISKPH